MFDLPRLIHSGIIETSHVPREYRIVPALAKETKSSQAYQEWVERDDAPGFTALRMTSYARKTRPQ